MLLSDIIKDHFSPAVCKSVQIKTNTLQPSVKRTGSACGRIHKNCRWSSRGWLRDRDEWLTGCRVDAEWLNCWSMSISAGQLFFFFFSICFFNSKKWSVSGGGQVFSQIFSVLKVKLHALLLSKISWHLFIIWRFSRMNPPDRLSHSPPLDSDRQALSWNGSPYLIFCISPLCCRKTWQWSVTNVRKEPL